MFDLTGKRALVTGASGGIGAAIAALLSKAGAEVALSGTRSDALDAAGQSMAGPWHKILANLSERESCDALIAQSLDLMGGLDILVNNAGLTRDGLAMRLKDEDWDSVLEINLTAAFRLTRAALRPMMKARFGRVINVTSVVGVTGNPGQANYCASKAGMIGMSKSIALEVASRGITVNCIAPGFIETPMTEALNEAQKEAIISKLPAARLGQPSDIANACLYLASEEAGYMTGQTLHINGGLALI